MHTDPAGRAGALIFGVRVLRVRGNRYKGFAMTLVSGIVRLDFL